jgi:hypothetical protein
MQDQLEIVREVISSFLKDRKEGKKHLVEWSLNSVMEEEARIRISADPYERTADRKAHGNGTGKRTLKTVEGTLVSQEADKGASIRDRCIRTIFKGREGTLIPSFLNPIFRVYPQGMSGM